MLRPWKLEMPLDKQSDKPIFIQIADAVIESIKRGKLQSGDALPGSRQLSLQLGLNRNTVVNAYEVLLAEGWLISKERKGIFVADNLPAIKAVKGAPSGPAEKENSSLGPAIIFDDGLPDSKHAPVDELGRAYRQIFSRQGRWKMMGYGDSAGHAGFRETLVQMLNYKRGMRLTADEIFVTRGSQMATFLTAQCLISKGDYVVIENPGYKPAWQALEYAGAKLLPVTVDEHGLNTQELKAILRKHKSVKAIYVTPHHQFPTTVTLSLPRRMELVALSNSYGFTIIEDDYDNEFHFGQRAVLPVSSMENASNFVYIGSMSKIVAPALRIGYMVSNKAFIQKVQELRRILDVQGDNIMEQAMHELIRDGNIRRHIKRATTAYKNKRDVFEQLIIKHLAGKVSFSRPDGGLAFWLVPLQPVNVNELAGKLLERGVQILLPERFSYGHPVNGLRLGYASLTERQMEEGIRILGELL
jgi:GntR family transcriptional regulator/MocR family aminotransferase